jgi:FkbM family methyltransferase
MASQNPCANGILHKARYFDRPPGRQEALTLLEGLATAPCPFSPVMAELPLALYGAGNFGRMARDHLRTVGLDCAMVIDRNAPRMASDPAWATARLACPDDVKDRAGLCVAVSIATAPYVPLERMLSDLGFKHVVPFYDLAESFRHLHPLSNGWFAPPLSAQDQEIAGQVLARWHDDTSRAHHLQFLAWRRIREEWTFDRAPVAGGNRFFIPEVMAALGDDEILLDAGAHHGEVTKAFVERTGGAFRQAVAIEPDPANKVKFEHELRAALPDDPRVSILGCALADDEGDAPFHDGLGYASQLSGTGKMRAAVRTIDALDVAPTFVKLHLEGAELAALKGAQGTLLANRPIVAATVYHNADGIWKTPHWLMETLTDYRFLFRAHSWCGTGAVVYAIPFERTG